MEFMVQQVLIVCPDVSPDDAKRDLVFTEDPQETINRIFDGNFLTGLPVPSLADDRESEFSSSLLRSTPSRDRPATKRPSTSRDWPEPEDSVETDAIGFVCNALPTPSNEERVPVRDAGEELTQMHREVDRASIENLDTAAMNTAQQRSNNSHGRAAPISITSSDHLNNSDDDELPSIFSSNSSSANLGNAPVSSKHCRTVGSLVSTSASTLLSGSKTCSTVCHIDISSSGDDSDDDLRCDKGKDWDRGNGMDGRSRTQMVNPESDSSSDGDDHIQLGLLQRLQGQNKKFKAAKVSSAHGTSRYAPSSKPSKTALDARKIIKEAIFGRGKLKPSEHLLSESDDEADAMETNDDFSERTTSSLASMASSMPCSTETDSLDSQTLFSQESYSSSSTSQKRPKRTREEIEAAKKLALERKTEKERKKNERARLLEEKKQQKQKEADQRKTIREAKRAEKPGECMKHMTVVMDSHVVEDPCGAQILAKLQTLECKYAIEAQPVPSCIRWRRIVMETNLLGEDIELDSMTTTKQEPEAIVVVPPSEFVEMVHAYKCEQRGEYSTGARSLCHHVRDMQRHLDGITPTLIVQGMEKYFRAKKNVHQRQYRNAVLGVSGEEAARGKKRKRKPEDIDIVVSRVDVEEALVDLQLRLACNVRFTETPEQVSDLVAMFTKAVAETPFKRKRDAAKFSFHVHVDWAGGVKVGRDGKGLLRVWRQQFQQFRNVSPEIATAIITQYPSPQLLLRAYKRCPNEEAAKKLLQDIVVRRGEGVLATSRRVGPELSRRVYQLFTSTNGELVL